MTHGLCEAVACASDAGLTIVGCGRVLCATHAYAHRFCTKDVGTSGCVVDNFVAAAKPLPENLMHRKGFSTKNSKKGSK